jgi:hypothetical protein
MSMLFVRTRRLGALCGSVCAGMSLAAATSSASAGINVDGTIDGQYGAALAVQTVNTQFGDNENELNAGYAHISGGMLYIMITGNLNDNFNSLELFIDSKAGGQAVYNSAGNGNTATLNGLVFDNGFTADYHIFAQRGVDMANAQFNLDFADLAALSASSYFDVMGGTQGAGNTGTGVNSNPILVGYNNNNLAGVLGGTDAANQAAALAVTTGFELAIDLSDLGWGGGPINIMVGVNNLDHNFWSNQFLSGLPADMMNGIPMGTGNLGGDGNGTFTGTGAVNFANIAGNQYFTVVPTPATFAVLGLLGFASRRRRA